MASDRERCYRSCADAQLSLHDCRRALGLRPGQCYPSSGYNGRCDANEFGLKKCLAFAANERDARVLYDTSQPRKARADANRRPPARLTGFHVPCTPEAFADRPTHVRTRSIVLRPSSRRLERRRGPGGVAHAACIV